MTPDSSTGEVSFVSRITVANLQDMGYQVNLNAADPFDKRNVNNIFCCFANRRNLRGDGDEDGDEEDGFEFIPLEAVLEDRAAKYAADRLRHNRENAPTDLPDGIKYWVEKRSQSLCEIRMEKFMTSPTTGTKYDICKKGAKEQKLRLVNGIRMEKSTTLHTTVSKYAICKNGPENKTMPFEWNIRFNIIDIP